MKALAQLLYPKLAWTKYPILSGTDRRTDGRTDRRTSSTPYPLVFTGDNDILNTFSLYNFAKIFFLIIIGNWSIRDDS